VTAYAPSSWTSLHTATTGAAGPLAGLLFIALSLGPQQLLDTPVHRGRAREALFQFLGVLVISVLVLIPGQRRLPLGVEITIVFIAATGASIRFQTQTVRDIEPSERGRWLVRLLVPNVATLAIGAAGVSLIVGRGGGLYWLPGAVLAYLLWSCSNAWLLLASGPGQLNQRQR
jgi:modulator of FtsH protease